MHSGPFCCLTKLGAQGADVVQKFVPRSRVGIFWNERTRSTPLDPKLTILCVSYYLCAHGTVCLPYETRYNTGRTSAKVRATKSRQIFRKKRIRSTALKPKLMFWCVSYYLGAFGTIWLPKILTQVCGTNFCTSLARFAPSFVRQPNGPECTQIV